MVEGGRVYVFCPELMGRDDVSGFGQLAFDGKVEVSETCS